MKLLPKDIKRTVILKVIFKIVLSLIWYSTIVICVISSYDLIITIQKFNILIFILILLVLIILALPFFAIKVHRVFIDKNWEGVVVKKIHKEIIDPKTLFKPMKKLVERKYITYIIIFDKKDKEHILSFDDEYESIAKYYKDGDEVVHYYGVKYLYNKNNITNQCICLNCGNIYDNSESICKHCKHTLLK